MGFSRARTPEQISSRQKEIIEACDKLFCQYGYDGVNFKAISDMTSFTRPTIYNYYQTKDEILLDLLVREMRRWQEGFIKRMDATAKMTKEEYSVFLTGSLAAHDKMLQLLSILFTVLEHNSGIEKLAEFKPQILQVLESVTVSVHKYFPDAMARQKEMFVSAFFSYILGLYPLSRLTQKQKEAIQLAGLDYEPPDFETMCRHGILLLLSEL